MTHGLDPFAIWIRSDTKFVFKEDESFSINKFFSVEFDEFPEFPEVAFR